MKVFMLGWEFPPFISGGLGTACYGLTKAMSNLGIQVTFALPKPVETGCEFSTHVKMLSPEQFACHVNVPDETSDQWSWIEDGLCSLLVDEAAIQLLDTLARVGSQLETRSSGPARTPARAR